MDIKQIKENKIRMILQFSIPSIIAMLLQTVITITDGYFTGNYVGQNALAAINLGLPILYFYLGTGLCIGVGGSVISGRMLGANERKKSSEVFSQTVAAALLTCVTISIIVFLLFTPILKILRADGDLSVYFTTGKVIHREYREKHNRQRSIDAALLDREFSRFTASPNYMLNCGLGTFLMPLCAIAVLWKGSELFEMLDVMFAETEGSVTLLLCVVFCGLVSMNFMTAPSVSLEGKSLWLLQSLPVEPWRIFRAKIRMQLLLTGLPLLLCIGCTETVYSMCWLQLLMILLFGGSYMLLMAQVGLFLGIKMPTMTWTNEIMPIKQGGAVIITLLCGFVYMILLFAGFMLLPGWRLGFCRYMICFVGANLFLSGWIYLWLRKKGTTRFSAL